MRKKLTLIYILAMTFFTAIAYGQTSTIRGSITDRYGNAVPYATVAIPSLKIGTTADSVGGYLLTGIPAGNWEMEVKYVGYQPHSTKVHTNGAAPATKDIVLTDESSSLDEVVVSGTMKEVSKLNSPVPVEVYTAKFFKANPVPSVFDALQNINGVRPQLNCNICNTGDIHINGLEGPYTMVLIDGMPIVSGLSTVYGLSGIPQSLIERVEIVKGPASTLYGSEAVGGLINIITKNPRTTPTLAVDAFGTSWGEINADVAVKLNAGRKVQSLLGANYFNYQHPTDNNHDNFTDVTLQHRISVFNKWNIEREDNRVFSFAARYIYEDRWGGEMNWSPQYRGGDEVYGESIYTSRWELFGTYQLPVKEHIILMFSANGHDQNSVYGDTPFLADQYIGFGQLTWNKPLSNHDLLAGLTYRYTYYDDNTPVTADPNDLGINKPTHTRLPGAFVQDEISLNDNNKLLLGMRYDYNSIHGSILTPRVNYKWNSLNNNNVLRLSFGNGYRVANVFTEDHSALTGAREVVFAADLNPETSWNGNLNFVKKVPFSNGGIVGFDATVFYTYFSNKIIADYDTDANQVIYDNLDGHAISQGISLNVDFAFMNGLKLMAGATVMDVYSEEDGQKIQQLFTERSTGVWSASYTHKGTGLTIDYTGNLYGPMRLPLLSDNDPRSSKSPWWSIQNIQVSRAFRNGIELYGGIKNLLNWTPNKGNPFIIARSHDPFDKSVEFDESGQALITPENPYGLTFDPSYVFGPNQGARGFVGIRYSFY
ncbi:TonB-dependent receptor [Parapedobacter koreensis]|uniref:Outer membrane receptor for ferrienterochelin and colicins n=1 Tax=Parapedobacter koreensis TaxID=332977 RepID=A0A1H7EY39_9SPHI|nr:TonB-dependent receptor [Parapedobacter koreensis]SEK18708.1 outer membrane receptor for ferrienterochelin and colicins [Parapedobacter koreensis]